MCFVTETIRINTCKCLHCQLECNSLVQLSGNCQENLTHTYSNSSYNAYASANFALEVHFIEGQMGVLQLPCQPHDNGRRSAMEPYLLLKRFLPLAGIKAGVLA